MVNLGNLAGQLHGLAGQRAHVKAAHVQDVDLRSAAQRRRVSERASNAMRSVWARAWRWMGRPARADAARKSSRCVTSCTEQGVARGYLRVALATRERAPAAVRKRAICCTCARMTSSCDTCCSTCVAEAVRCVRSRAGVCAAASGGAWRAARLEPLRGAEVLEVDGVAAAVEADVKAAARGKGARAV